jgi:hypothetical protein
MAPKQAIFSQGEPADAVFYIQEGTVKVSVVSKQGKEATIALLGPGDFFERGMHRIRSTGSHGNCYYNYAVFCQDRKERDATHAPPGTPVFRSVCCVHGSTSQPYSSEPGRSTVQLKRKAPGAGAFNTGPVRKRRQVRGSDSWSEARDSGGNDWHNAFTSELLHE